MMFPPLNFEKLQGIETPSFACHSGPNEKTYLKAPGIGKRRLPPRLVSFEHYKLLQTPDL
jgi:hypothetical protein